MRASCSSTIVETVWSNGGASRHGVACDNSFLIVALKISFVLSVLDTGFGYTGSLGYTGFIDFLVETAVM